MRGHEQYLFNNVRFSTRSQLALGKWTDLVFMVDRRTAAYRVWRREGEKKFARVLIGVTPILAGREIYIKQVLYRGGGNVGGRTDVLWIGPTARGTSFAAVEG